MMKMLSATTLVVVWAIGTMIPLVASVGAAQAQSNPSVLQTIEALKPKPGKSRGSRPVVAPPAGDGTTVSAPAPVQAALPAPTHSVATAPSFTAPVQAAPVQPASLQAAPVPAAPVQPTVRPAAIAAIPARPAPVEADAPSIDYNILFASGSADLTPAAARSLETLGQALASPDLSGSKFRIEGHTDTVGAPDANRALSARRAAAVVDFLTSRFPINRNRLESAGMGSDALVVPTPDQTPEPRNRRVRIVNITG